MLRLKIAENEWIIISNDGSANLPITETQSGIIEGEVVPKLSVAQLTALCNYLLTGVQATITLTNKSYVVKGAKSSNNSPVIFFDFDENYTLIYSVPNNEVVITAKEIGSGSGAVESVNGQTGAVVLKTSDIKNNDNKTIDEIVEDIADDLSDESTAREQVETDLAAEVSAREDLDDRVEAVETSVEDLQALIPSQASSSNQLADKDFVNSSITTNTATFRGTFDVVDDLELTQEATHAEVAIALAGKVSGATDNDYSFVYFKDAQGQVTHYDRYKYNGSVWSYEFTLNNSSFTANQWNAINSGITSGKITTYDGYATQIAAKADNNAVVHSAGNETAAGVKTFSDGIKTGVIGNTQFDDVITLLANGNSRVRGIEFRDANGTIGSSTRHAKEIYGNKIYGASGNGIDTDNIAEKTTVETISTATYAGGLSSKIEYKFTVAATSLSIAALEAQTGDLTPCYKVKFVVGSGFVFASTPTLVWKDGTPVWTELVGEEVEILIEPSLTANQFNAWIIK